MKTDDLVALLADGGGQAEPNAVAHRYETALGIGALGALLLMAIMLGVRPDFAEAVHLPMFWIKLALPASLLIVSVHAATRLARPGARLGYVPVALIVPPVLVGILASIELLQAPPAARLSLMLGSTWRECPFNILLLSLPAFVACFWAMRRLAPTRLALAGAASGLLAGALGALVYALHCTEMEPPFLVLWYGAGMLIPSAIGALLGPRLLRW